MVSEPLSWISPQQVIRGQGFSPLRSLGQNFMMDRGVLRYMVEHAEFDVGDVVIEIGPGTGALTQYLLAQDTQVTCVELDRGLATYLKDSYASEGLQVVHGDILDKKWGINLELLELLKTMPSTTGRAPKWISNLPYNILTPFLWNLLHRPQIWSLGLFLVQKEFIDRLNAKPGDDNYSPLSVVSQLFLDVEGLRNVGKGCFWPAPEVESAIMRARPKINSPTLSLEFVDFLKCSFAQRRKVMLKLLKPRYPREDTDRALEKCQVNPDVRAESLTPQQLWAFHQSLRAIG
jgi:16S rRNA (adenine1518-N6/adenine1519-N6)-dimethyltransferase